MIYDELIEMSEPDKRFSLLFTFFIHYVATTFTTLQKRSIFISVGPTTNTPNKNLCSGTWILLTERKWYGLYSTTSMNAPKTFTGKRWSSYNSPKFMGSKLGDDWNILFVCFFLCYFSFIDYHKVKKPQLKAESLLTFVIWFFLNHHRPSLV